MVPTWTGRPGKNGKTFSSQGILIRLEKSGKFTQNAGKVRKFKRVLIFIFFLWTLFEVNLLNRFLYLLNSSNKTLKKYWKMEKK